MESEEIDNHNIYLEPDYLMWDATRKYIDKLTGEDNDRQELYRNPPRTQ